jgi:hypothetical protein
MFEAYKVAVRVSLINGVSGGLLGMSRQFAKVDGDAKRLQSTMELMQKRMMIGGAMMATGFFGLKIFDHALKPAEEYASTLNRLKMAGWNQVEIAGAVSDAWKNTHTVITSTVNQNLSSLLDLKNILGNLDEARQALPIVTRVQAVLQSSSEGKVSGNAKDLAYSMTKALDVIGAAKNMPDFEKQAGMMAKAIIATQGRVTPEAFKGVFQYTRQAKFQLSDAYKYTILPTLIQENASSGGGGGGSRGVGPMQAAFYRWAIQGYINKKSLPLLESLGLVKANTALSTTTQETTVGAMKDANLAASNPFEWSQKVLIPAIYKKYGKNITQDQLLTHINQAMRGNQSAAAMMAEFAAKPQNFIRDAANIQQTMSVGNAYKAAVSHDPKIAGEALSAQWENFKTATLMSVVPVLIPALIKLTDWLTKFTDWARENQTTVKYLALGFAGLSAALAFGGALTLVRVGFQGLGLLLGGGSLLRSIGALAGRFGGLVVSGVTKIPTILGFLGNALMWVGRALLANPIGLAIMAVAAAGIYIYRHWATIGPYVMKVWHIVSTAFREGIQWVWTSIQAVWKRLEPFAKLFGHIMGAVFDFIVDGVSKAFHAISNIITKIWEYIANSRVGKAIGWVKDKTVEGAHAVARGANAALNAGDAWATREDRKLAGGGVAPPPIQWITAPPAGSMNTVASLPPPRIPTIKSVHSVPRVAASPSPKQAASAHTASSPYVAPRKGQTVQVNSTVNLDGRAVGKAVTTHVANEVARPQTGRSGFDPSAAAPPIGLSYAF